MGRSSLVIRGRGEHTKKRHQIDMLLKRATKGDGRAKLKLYKEFGIRLYSSGEVDEYVRERLPQECDPDGKRTSSPSRVKQRERARKLVKKI